MTRFARRLTAALVLAGAAAGCTEESKPANPAATQPNEKAISKEKMKGPGSK